MVGQRKFLLMLSFLVMTVTVLISGVTCHKGHHYLPGEISHQQSASFLLDREKRATDCFNEPACERDKPSCQSQNEPVREEYCKGYICSSGTTCYLSTPCPAHYQLSCIADPCASFPCEHDGTCTKLSDSTFSCSCVAGYDPSTNCATEFNECDSNPCQNGATCVDDLNSYTCSCQSGYQGTHCETEINECDSNPCQNGATCVDELNRYSCTCQPGYQGTNCETEIDECDSNPCQNGATCVDELNKYSCTCQPGYQGTQCETDIDECSSNPCQNGAQCVDYVNRYSCTCVPGYQGSHCETDVNECDSNPCQNSATCVDEVNKYSCTCQPGYQGSQCETETNECNSNPCQNGASCIDEVNRYTCSCVSGYMGTHCETDINECNSNPCQNGAQCVDEVNRYSCNCVPGYLGTHCETDINECSSNPCQNGATCVDKVNRYSCTCVSGYMGIHCETEINECDSNPCQNGAQCVDYVNKYSCTCVPGYMGTNCEIDIDECQSSPCQNGGSCNDLVNRFECTCSGRYNGTVCEKDCRPGPADILFVVDSSESADFNRSLDFMFNIIQNLSIGPDDFQIAMVTFSSNATLEFAFDEYRDNQSLFDAVNGVTPEYGPTFLTQALALAEQISSGTANGRRPSVPCYVVILTDGLATDVHEYVTQARLMQWRGVRMMGVGIGSSVSHIDLITLSSNIDDVFSPDNDDMLNTILRETSHQDCNDCILRKDSDIIFLVDVTQKGQELASVSRTMREISSFFSFGMNESRIGLMTYASNVTNQFSLTTHTDHNTLYPALSKFPQIDDDADMIYALRYVRDIGFAPSNGGRLDSRKIVVMYSSGNWSDFGTLHSEFKNLMSEGYHLFNVVTSYDEAKVNTLIGHFKPTYGIINAMTEDSQSVLETIAAEATYEICDKDIFIKRAI